jgi:hypothetical protein
VRFTRLAKGITHKPGRMNKLEESYSWELEKRRLAGQLLWYRFEGMKVRLADNTFYTPDFFVMLTDGSLEAHEVKGFWQDTARVKIKVAAEHYPFLFRAIKKVKGQWLEELF